MQGQTDACFLWNALSKTKRLGELLQESILSPIDRRSEAYRHLAAEAHKDQPSTRQPLMTIPNICTYFRLALVPALLGLWEYTSWTYSPIACAAIFITAALTDWLDGYLARAVSEGIRWVARYVMGWPKPCQFYKWFCAIEQHFRMHPENAHSIPGMGPFHTNLNAWPPISRRKSISHP